MPIKLLTKHRNIIEFAGLLMVLPVLYFCCYPNENFVSQIISENAIIVMLSFFVAGIFAIYFKLNTALLYCWISCSALCHHLKDSQVNHFYYSKADSSKFQIKLAHYDLDSTCDMITFAEKVKKISSNILSLRLDNQLRNDSTFVLLKKIYPHHFFCDLNNCDNKSRFIFSKFEIDSIETFSWNNESLLLGVVNIDNKIGKLYFLNLSLNDKYPDKKDSSLYHLNKFTDNCKEKYFKNYPAIAFGDTPYFHWYPELRDYRNKNALKDSRLDLELNLNRKHIFYSEHLDCIGFEQDGNGVFGVYQLSNIQKHIPKDLISQRH